jgi:sulfur carrier protein ThiS
MPFLTLPAFVVDDLTPRPEKGGSKLRIEGVCLKDVFQFLRTQHPRAVGRIFTDDGDVRKNVIVVVNDELVPRSDVSKLMLADLDELALIMQFAGG